MINFAEQGDAGEMPLISCRNLSLGYEGRIIVSGLNFNVNTGDFLAVTGGNGCGKSTLLKVILGIDKPAAGTIIFGDGLSRNEIGFLPQQPEILNGFSDKAGKVVLQATLIATASGFSTQRLTGRTLRKT
jgi:zinc transport system ATP-binding protein